jgi:DNA invertase Pin-like site-specific DNA recombinase
MIIGYARVSTLDQNEQLQTDALTKAGCGRLFVDHASGAKAHRPELDHLLDVIREGDTLIVWKLDRLGRSVQNLVDLMNLLQSRGVGFKSLTENMDTTTPGGVLIFNVFAAMAQFERDLIRERTSAGLQAARARGRKGGRPSKLSGKQRARIRELYRSRALTVQSIANQYQVARNTIYGIIRSTEGTDGIGALQTVEAGDR